MTDTPESLEALRKFILKAKSDDPGSPAWNIMDHLMKRGDTIERENAVLRRIVERAEEELRCFELGHTHKADDGHYRPMGDTYGWCSYCHKKVGLGEDRAREALADITEMKKEIE